MQAARVVDRHAESLSAAGGERGPDALVLQALDLVHEEQGCEGLGALGEELRSRRVDVLDTSDQLLSRADAGPRPVLLDTEDRRTHLTAKGKATYNSDDNVASQAIRISPDGLNALVLHADQL